MFGIYLENKYTQRNLNVVSSVENTTVCNLVTVVITKIIICCLTLWVVSQCGAHP